MTIHYKSTVFSGNLGEEHQAVKIKTALAKQCIDKKSRYVTNIMPFVRCRDFYSDILYGQSFQVPELEKYGFKWSYDATFERRRLNNKTILLLLSYGGDKFKQYLQDNLTVLYTFEKDMGMRRTRIRPTQDSSVDVLIFDSNWMRNSLLMNFYTLLLRLCSTPLEFSGANSMDIIHNLIEFSEKLDEIRRQNHHSIMETGRRLKEYDKYAHVSEYTGDIQKIKTIYKNKDACRAFIHNWREWCGDTKQPVEYSGLSAIGKIHTNSCVYSFFSKLHSGRDDGPLSPFIKNLKAYLKT